MHLLNIILLFVSTFTTVTPHHLNLDTSPSIPTLALPVRDSCPKEPHCALITYDSMKQIELDDTPCTDLKDGIVYGVLVASCTCYVFSNYGCTGYFDKFEQCPGLQGPDFKDGKTVGSVRCEGQ